MINSRKYYDDCAQILTEHVLAAIRPNSLKGFSTLDPLVETSINTDQFTNSSIARPIELPPPASLSPARTDRSNKVSCADPTTLIDGALPVREIPHDLISEPASLENSMHSPSSPRRDSLPDGTHQEELRCVLAVVRHGDRTPKQKIKLNMTEPLILQYFDRHSSDPCRELKVKAKALMVDFLDTVRTILAQKNAEKAGGVRTESQKKEAKLLNQLLHMRDILERWKFTGLNRKLQIKPRKWDDDKETGKRCTEVQLILKWGGDLTKLGEKQAIKLGERFRREMYPDSPACGGILRLHSTFRHDMKINTSDEGRVMKTAAAFAKGLLELEGEIPPILVSLVHKEKGSMHMLDPSGDKGAKLELDDCKEKITTHLQGDIEFKDMTSEDRERMLGPEQLKAMHDALAEVRNPRQTLEEIYKIMGSLINQLEEMLGVTGMDHDKAIELGEGTKDDDENDVGLSGVKLYTGETLLELTERWRFIYKKLYDSDENRFDLSRIPDVHDNVRFDVLHNPHLGLSSTLQKLYELAKSMADCVVPQEYGTTVAEKRSVGVKICSSLLEKIRYDLNIARTDNKVDMRYMINMDYSVDLSINSLGRRIRTRLYFTSESHLHTMLNVLRFTGVDDDRSVLSKGGLELINNTRELCYLTQIVIRLFEDTSRPMENPKRFRVEILFSPGATATPLHIDESNRNTDSTRFDTAPLNVVSRDGLTCEDIEAFFGSAIFEGVKKRGVHKSVPSTSTLRQLFEPPVTEGGKDRKSTPVEKEEEGAMKLDATSEQSPGNDSTTHRSLEQAEPTEGAEKHDKETERKDDIPVDLGSKYVWFTIAIGSILLGATCLAMAFSMTGDPRNRRRFSKR